MTEILDSKGTLITVGARVLGWDRHTGRREEVGTVYMLSDPDGDVNEYGRQVAVGPYVFVRYDDGTMERWTATWNATGPWDDHRTDYTCDDVTVATGTTEPIGPDTRLGWFEKRGEGVDLGAVEALERYARGDR